MTITDWNIHTKQYNNAHHPRYQDSGRHLSNCQGLSPLEDCRSSTSIIRSPSFSYPLNWGSLNLLWRSVIQRSGDWYSDLLWLLIASYDKLFRWNAFTYIFTKTVKQAPKRAPEGNVSIARGLGKSWHPPENAPKPGPVHTQRTVAHSRMKAPAASTRPSCSSGETPL